LGPNKVMSVPDGIGIAIEKWMHEKHEGVQQDLLAPQRPEATVRPISTAPSLHTGSQQPQHSSPVSHTKDPGLLGACPDCGSQLEFAEGCVKCHVCGFSECG
ncbi:MAG: response regulator SirA, partial [Gemmatimonadales bacterium]